MENTIKMKKVFEKSPKIINVGNVPMNETKDFLRCVVEETKESIMV